MRVVLASMMLAAFFAQTGAVVRTADPIKRGMKVSDFPRTVKVGDNIYTYEDFHAGDEKFTTTNLFVVTDEGVLVADGQGSVAATKGLVDAIARVTSKPIKYVVICSDHGDHTAGNAAFPAGVTYITHPTSKAILDRAAASRSARDTSDSGGRAASASASRGDAAPSSGRGTNADSWQLPSNAVLVSDKQSFTLGGQPFDVLFLGRAHTGGDLAVWLPQRRTLFLSEIFLNRVFPAMRSAYPSDWLRTLDRAEAMKAEVYVPGHGFTETGSVSREELVAYHKALQAVIDEATRLHKAGVSVDDAIKQASFGDYARWTLASSQAPIAIRKVYEELDGRLK
jgi:glyoxylase-like metal-dependent hydrolase (beta-lactamase superfamily II)